MSQNLNWDDSQSLIASIKAESGQRKTIAFGYIINSLVGFAKTEAHLGRSGNATKFHQTQQKVWDAFPEMQAAYNTNEKLVREALAKYR